jgi:hypothetical protein
VLVSVTNALGTTAPLSSRTVPLEVAVLAWGQADGTTKAIMRTQKNTFRKHVNLCMWTSLSKDNLIKTTAIAFTCQELFFCVLVLRMRFYCAELKTEQKLFI